MWRFIKHPLLFVVGLILLMAEPNDGYTTLVWSLLLVGSKGFGIWALIALMRGERENVSDGRRL